MKTYYPYRAAAKYANVSPRTIYRWKVDGYLVSRGRIFLKVASINGRLCVEEGQLKAFLSARRKFLESKRKRHEKFTI